MSDPYVIWTMRRTGGTTLATLLSLLSEHPRIQHEPFNTDRKLGQVTKDFLESGSKRKLKAALLECLATRPVIKHCYELIGPVFNATLMQAATELGYRHIILDRHNETDRIASLGVAQLTGVWGRDEAQQKYPAIEAGEVMLGPMDAGHAMHQLKLCHQRRLELAKLTARAKPAPFVVYFEDIYTDPQAGRVLIERLLAYLGIQPQDFANYEQLIGDALAGRDQQSRRIFQEIPNFEQVCVDLDAFQKGRNKVFRAS